MRTRQTSLAALLDRSKVVLGVAACLAALFASARAGDAKKNVEPRKPTAAQLKIARAIASGHAYEKHVVKEELFPEVKSRKEFADLIARILANPTDHRELQNGRDAYFDRMSNTIVIYNRRARERGTCFRPVAGLRYFQNLK